MFWMMTRRAMLPALALSLALGCDKPRETNPLAYDVKDQERLWQMSEEMVQPWL